MAIRRSAVEGLVRRVTGTALVVGASGQIGEHCLCALGAAGTGTYHEQPRPGMIALDIRDADAFERVVAEVRPEVIYLAACRADVEWCELNPDQSWQTNVGGVANAVSVANRHRCKLVYLSSEYVFDGASGPYRESAPANPISVYGGQKLAAEHHIAHLATDWLIVRTTVVYSIESQGKNFVTRLINTLRSGNPIRVPHDQISSPTYAPDLVGAMMQLAQRNARGLFHIAGPRTATRYAFAVAAARIFGLDEGLVTPVSTAELNQVAARPLRAGLIVEKAERALGRSLIDYEAGLREMAASHALR